MELNIGIDSADREEIAAGLSRLLADSYTLYLKTHNYHWNVEGPLFNTLHQMFEVQYTELAAAVDEIAERIRALGVKAPGSYSAFLELASVEESRGGESAENMIRELVLGQEAVVRTARNALPAVAMVSSSRASKMAMRIATPPGNTGRRSSANPSKIYLLVIV